MSNHASGQPLPWWVTWACCDQVHDDGTPCTGAAQSNYGRCLAHLGDTQLASMMTHRPDEAPPDLDARGVRLTPDDLKRVLAAARSEDPSLRLRQVLLGRAIVEGYVGDVAASLSERPEVSFSKAVVEGSVSFSNAVVKGNVSFSGTVVKGSVSFDEAVVKGDVSFFMATVEGRVFFDGASIEGDLSLGPLRVRSLFHSLELTAPTGATVKGDVSLKRVTIAGDLLFAGATIEGGLSLGPPTIKGHPSRHPSLFDRLHHDVPTIVKGDVGLGLATVRGDVDLGRATIEGHASLEGARIEGRLSVVLATIQQGLSPRRQNRRGKSAEPGVGRHRCLYSRG